MPLPPRPPWLQRLLWLQPLVAATFAAAVLRSRPLEHSACGTGDEAPCHPRQRHADGGAAAAPAALPALPQRTPPIMGWSSWYAFGDSVTQAKMEASFEKMVQRTEASGNRSLRDAGYVYANLDDGWQDCHAGVDGSFHSEAGEPLVNKTRFPNIGGMARRAHELGLKPGFYYNNYICAEATPKGGIGGKAYMRNMRGSVEFLKNNEFDFVKLDSGSVYNDLQLWHDLIAEAGRPIAIENCHQGSNLPNASWCPFDMFRTSGDLHVVGLDVELLAAARLLGRARQDCWAYPDTIDAGSPAAVRTQLGAYAAMSSPLLLSFNILQEEKLMPIWDILTNPEAIAVNQQWAGSPGRLLRKWSQYDDSQPWFPWAEACDEGDGAQAGWFYNQTMRAVMWQPSGAHGAGGGGAGGSERLCLASGGPKGKLELRDCSDADPKQRWLLRDGRLWEGVPSSSLLEVAQPPPPGVLGLAACNGSRSAQRWAVGEVGGEGTIKNLRPFHEEGACMEIAACSDAEGAQVDVLWGCKTVPPPKKTDVSPCDRNMVWRLKSDGTITSAMNGKCLQVDPHNPEHVNVGSCRDGASGQRWRVDAQSIRSVDKPGLCIDSGFAPPPEGGTGRCAALEKSGDIGGGGAWEGDLGPALILASADKCDTAGHGDQAALTFRLSGPGGRLVAASGRECLAGRRGEPTISGPLQLWGKPLPGGAAAAVVLNRGSEDADVRVRLPELEGLGPAASAALQGGAGEVKVRDVWARSDLAPVAPGGDVEIRVPAGDSRFLVFRPPPSPATATEQEQEEKEANGPATDGEYIKEVV